MNTPLKVMRPKWVKSGGNGSNRVCEIRGLPSNYYRDPHAMVDASLASLIARLNAHGLRTAYCCSGIRRDHDAVRMKSIVSGYIMFERPMPKRLVNILPREVVESTCTIRVKNPVFKVGVGVDENRWAPIRRAILAFIERDSL